MFDYLGWFEFLGRNSQEFGIVITGYDVYSSPKRDTSTVKIPYLNGEIIQSNGRFENVSVSYHCGSTAVLTIIPNSKTAIIQILLVWHISTVKSNRQSKARYGDLILYSAVSRSDTVWKKNRL